MYPEGPVVQRYTSLTPRVRRKYDPLSKCDNAVSSKGAHVPFLIYLHLALRTPRFAL